MNQLTIESKNGKASFCEMPKQWRIKSVQEFFTAINWDLQPLAVQQIKQAALQGSSEPLSEMLSVTQFFSCFAWEGKTVAAPIAEAQPLEPPQEKAEEFTLDDFSSLF